MFEYLYNLVSKNSVKTDCNEDEEDVILTGKNNNLNLNSNTMYNPIEKKFDFLQDLTNYTYKSNYKCSLSITFKNDKKIVDIMTYNGKFYKSGNKNYSKYIINYCPLYDKGNIILEMKITKNNIKYDNNSISFNYIMHDTDNEKNKNINFNSNTHKILICVEINNLNKYFLKEVFFISLQD